MATNKSKALVKKSGLVSWRERARKNSFRKSLNDKWDLAKLLVNLDLAKPFVNEYQ